MAAAFTIVLIISHKDIMKEDFQKSASESGKHDKRVQCEGEYFERISGNMSCTVINLKNFNIYCILTSLCVSK